VQLLLNRGADASVVTNLGATALIIASQNGHLAVVQLLLSKSTEELNVLNNFGVSPLWTACFHDHTDVATVLLMAGGTLGDIEDDDDAPPAVLRTHALATQAACARFVEEKAAALALDDAEAHNLSPIVARTLARATQAACTRFVEKEAAALERERKANAAKDAMLGRTWALVSPLPDTTEADKPSVAAFVADPESVIAPFEGHPSRQRGWIEREIDRGMRGDSSDGD